MANTLGERIRAERQARGMTLTELGRRAGVSPGMLSDLEQNRSKGSTRLHEIAKALQVNPHWLAAGSGHKSAHGISEAAPSTYHGYIMSEEAAMLAGEWDKLEGPLKEQIREMIEVLVAKQVKKGRKKQRSMQTPHRGQYLDADN